MSALLELISLIPPPKNSPYNFDWDKVEKELNTTLPDEYKAMANIYGSGEFVSYIRLFAPSGLYNLTELAHGLVEAYFFEDLILLEELQEKDPIFMQKPLPLLAWASTSSEEVLYFLKCDPNPNKWKIFQSDAVNYCVFNGTVTEFLLGVFTGKIHNEFVDGFYNTPITNDMLQFDPQHEEN